jgi:CDP-glucose 4,6-dehydratase
MRLFADCYRGRKVLITGNTGFKGSWLVSWLCELGANITGLALPPEDQPNHWDLIGSPISQYIVDIRDPSAVEKAFSAAQPEIVFHLAAQSLVRDSYRKPLETWCTNVMGTANVLEACRHTSSVRAVVVITTDKCYENHEWSWGYRETDPIGGHDPYSASKAGAELVVASYRRAFFKAQSAPLLATARAGNVIGGGDWSTDRLIPDLVRAIERGQSLEIRSPLATRPWQHVLECLSGYLVLGQRLLLSDKNYAEAWNFGPESEGNRTVSEVLGKLSAHWPNLRWHVSTESQPHEAVLLYLDSAKARSKLHWQPVWGLSAALGKTAEWYRAWLEGGKVITHEQLTEYVAAAAQANVKWVKHE